jgi:hypothetical protein
MRRQSLVLYGIVAGLALLSFLATYAIYNNTNSDKPGQVRHDQHSDTTYNTGAANNYRDSNPYGSFFVGFEELSDRGVSNSEYIYITDVLTNFTMYSKKIYNGKISFIKDSFIRKFNSDFDSQNYSFKVSINNGKPYSVNVISNPIKKKISIKITSSNNASIFEKSFHLYSADEAS